MPPPPSQCYLLGFYDGEIFKLEFLCLIPLETYPTGRSIFVKVKGFLEKKMGLGLQKVNLLVTDGGPSVTGKETPSLPIRSTSSLRHCLYKTVLQDISAEFSDLLQHDFCWLSSGMHDTGVVRFKKE